MAALVYTLLILRFLIDSLADWLNARQLSLELPPEFQGVYPQEKYAQSLRYLRDKTYFGLFRSAVSLAAFFAFLLLGGFEWADGLARGAGLGPIATGLVFAGVLSVLSSALKLPFSVYDTFVIEERYGFNRTTPKTFVTDLIKGTLVGAVLGALVFSGILWFFETAGSSAWLWAWITVTAFQLVVMYLAPVLLLPMFNKFSPLPDGPLKEAIESYARSQRFALSGIFTMDSSKRSTKSNAFFTGFGRFRRLVLFDTLIERQTVPELTAVVAHEVGHFKEGHILKSMVLSIGLMGAIFYSLNFWLGNPALFETFRMSEPSAYATILLIGIIYGPVMRLLSVPLHYLSRKHEFEADDWAVKTYARPDQLVEALKKLSVDNLSNLKPHPLKVLLDYTHPPILLRIAALNRKPQAS